MPEAHTESYAERPQSLNVQAEVLLTWCVNDSEVGTKLVLYFDNNFLGPELLFSLQAGIFILYVVLQIPCKVAVTIVAL